jgi:UDP-N-acetylmuramoylalanine--D-glutamate ligase
MRGAVAERFARPAGRGLAAAGRALAGRRVVVVGLARSGLAACRLLLRLGARVLATDQKPAEQLPAEVGALRGLGVGLELGGHTERTFTEADLVLVSPGVPRSMRPLELARRAGVPVVGEVELAYWCSEAPFAAVTGSNGKSTTTALLGAMLREAGIPVTVAGNIGIPLCGVAPDLAVSHWIVAEISSFQLETTEAFRPAVAVFLNLSPNHLDRHADLDEYYGTKARIFRAQEAADRAVLNADDPEVLARAQRARARRVHFSRRGPVRDGAFVADGQILLGRDGRATPVCPAAALRIPGAHNLENALAAAAAAAEIGAAPAAVAAALGAFPGLEHRLELVATVRGVRYVNDSKGTTVDAVRRSLESFSGGIVLIAGGKDKGGDFRPLAPLLRERVKVLVLIGEARAKLREQLAGACGMADAGTMDEAVRAAAAHAAAGDVVLLSPGCASFDMFRDFEDRGRAFKAAVALLEAGRTHDR